MQALDVPPANKFPEGKTVGGGRRSLSDLLTYPQMVLWVPWVWVGAEVFLGLAVPLVAIRFWRRRSRDRCPGGCCVPRAPHCRATRA